MISGYALAALLERFDNAVVACAGDVMLDNFVRGEVDRISPEAPIPVLRIERRQSMLGGAGNAVRNLSAIGCKTRLFAVAGDDPEAEIVADLLRHLPGNRSHVARDPARVTTTKTRFVAHGQQLLRADNESTAPADPASARDLLEAFSAALPECSIVLLCDYAKGVLGGTHAAEFIHRARAAGKPVIVDPKGRDFIRYKGATLIKPNLKELSEATGLPVGTERQWQDAARALLQQTEAGFILVTCGSRGMMLASVDGPVLRFPAMAREVYDVSGAGDTVAAVLAAALGSGASIADAVETANLAAGIVVGKTGTATVDRTELMHEARRRSSPGSAQKVLRLGEAAELVDRWKRSGLRVGFAAGSFHVLEPCHLELLEGARASCDRLIVGIGSDSGTELAPPRSGADRALIVASLGCVDAVVLDDEGSAAALFLPDIAVEERLSDTAGERPARTGVN